MNRIMVAVDGSDHAHEALKLASVLALHQPTEVLLVHAVSSQEPSDAVRHAVEVEYADEFRKRTNKRFEASSLTMDAQYAKTLLSNHAVVSQVANSIFGEQILANASDMLHHQGVDSVQSVLVEGDPSEKLLESIDNFAVDTVVMGCRGVGKLKGLLGSVSQQVAHHAKCKVIMVK